MPEAPQARSSTDGGRLVAYWLRAAESVTDKSVLVAVRALREHASRFVVVTDRPLSDDEHASLLHAVDDIVLLRQDPMSSVDAELGAWIDACEAGDARFAEVIVTDDSWFGPVASLAAVFDRMDACDADAWTMTSDPETWLAVRRDANRNSTWAHRLVAVRAASAPRSAQARTAKELHANDRDIVVAEAFPLRRYASPDPGLLEPDALLADGCPLLARRVFTQDPALLERHAVIGRRLVDHTRSNGYDIAPLMQSLARSVAPSRLHAVLGLLEIPLTGAAPPSIRPQRILVLVHFGEDADTDSLRANLPFLPAGCDVIATVGSTGDATQIRALLDTAIPQGAGHIEVIRVPDDADDVASAFVGCRDALCGDGYDLIVKVRTAQPRGTSSNARRLLRRQTWENLFSSSDHFSRVLELFEESGLGLVFPHPPHIGFNTLGAGWGDEGEDASRLCAMQGIDVPLGSSPLSPVGGMWIARADALRLIASHPWTWDDYRSTAGWRTLGQTQESLLAHAAGALGMHTRTLLTAKNAAVSYAPLDYKLDQLTATTDSYPLDQIRLLRRLGWVGTGGMLDSVRMYLRANHPWLGVKSKSIQRLAAPRRSGITGGAGPKKESAL